MANPTWVENANKWAKSIADDNSYHYLKWKGSDSKTQKCPICNKQPKGQYHGWNCIGFAYACWHHGAGIPCKCNCGVIDNGTAEKLLNNCTDAEALKKAQTKLGIKELKVIKNKNGVPKSQWQPGDIGLLFRGKKYIHTFYIVGDGKIADSTSGGGIGSDKNIRVRSWGSSSAKIILRYTGEGGKITPITGETTGTGSSQSGEGVDLRDSIAKLYQSDNYKYVYAEEEEEKEESPQSKFINSVKSYLTGVNSTSTTSSTTSSGSGITYAVPESTINSKLIETEFEHDKPKKVLTGKASQLLSYPTWVEAPTIILDFNGTKIGGYGNKGDRYPNYITSMSVKKINGRINQYTLNLTYQIRPGEDPNFIDKLIAKTGYENPLKILYGDSNYPNSYYKEESAVIMDAQHSEDVSSYRINYTISAISSIGVAQTSLTTFKEKTDRPSNLIYELLYNSGSISKSLIELFPGMRNRTLVASKGLIPTNDKIVKVGGMANASPLSYLSYLVACMSNSNNNSTYYLTLVDNSYSEFNGAYFKIDEIISYNNNDNSDVEISSNYFELDIGYPTDNYITSFQLCNNNYWSLVYNYAGDIPKFEYGIDDNGDLIQRQTNILYSNNKYNEASLINSTWWKQVTEFPISAKVTIKGLLSPALLMSYIKVNTLFYGQRDMASGLYVVTAQEDSISGSGYTTELTLLRVSN